MIRALLVTNNHVDSRTGAADNTGAAIVAHVAAVRELKLLFVTEKGLRKIN